MTPQDFKITFRVQRSPFSGFRLWLAKAMLWAFAALLKVRVKATADEHKATRKAEVDNHREMIYRGTPVADILPTQNCVVCGIQTQWMFRHKKGIDPLCSRCHKASDEGPKCDRCGKVETSYLLLYLHDGKDYCEDCHDYWLFTMDEEALPREAI
jgi:hypothetical protein